MVMAKVDDLLNLAQNCYAQAKATLHPLTKRELAKVGDEYQKKADDLRLGRTIIQAAFPKPGRKIGQD